MRRARAIGVATALPLALAAVLDVSCTSITGLDDLAFDVVPVPEGCVPGTQSRCYSGQEGTEGVGSCRAGEHTCLSDGVSYSDCSGEVIPAAQEDCYTKALEACGLGECRGFAAWSFSFGSEGTEDVSAMAAADDGGAVLVSVLGDDTETRDARIDRIDPIGQLAAPKTFGGAGDQIFTAVAERGFDIVVTGYFESALDLGDGPAASQGERDGLVGVFDSTLMTLRDKLLIGSVASEFVTGLAVGPNGQIAIAGGCQGDLTIETLAVGAASGGPFVALLEPALTPIWGVNLSPLVVGASSEALVAFDTDGHVLVTGGGGLDACVATSEPGAHLAKLDSLDGTCLWSFSILKEIGPGFQEVPQITAIAVGPDGPMIAGIYFESSASEGEPVGAGHGAFITQLSSDGTPRWTQTLTVEDANAAVSAVRLAVTPAATYVTGSFTGTLTAGSTPLLVNAEGDNAFVYWDMFVVRLDPGGEPVWANRFGDAMSDFGKAIVATPDGASIVAGTFRDTMALGQDPLMSNGGYDVVVARLNP